MTYVTGSGLKYRFFGKFIEWFNRLLSEFTDFSLIGVLKGTIFGDFRFGISSSWEYRSDMSLKFDIWAKNGVWE